MAKTALALTAWRALPELPEPGPFVGLAVGDVAMVVLMMVGTPMVMVVAMGMVIVEVLVAVTRVEEAEPEAVVVAAETEEMAKQAAAMVEAAEIFILVGSVCGESVCERECMLRKRWG